MAQLAFAHNRGNYLRSIPGKIFPSGCWVHFEETSWKYYTASHFGSDHVATTNEPLQSLFGTRPRPPPLKGFCVVVLVRTPSAITVFTPAQRNLSKGENKTRCDLTGLKSAGVKTPLSVRKRQKRLKEIVNEGFVGHRDEQIQIFYQYGCMYIYIYIYIYTKMDS